MSKERGLVALGLVAGILVSLGVIRWFYTHGAVLDSETSDDVI